MGEAGAGASGSGSGGFAGFGGLRLGGRGGDGAAEPLRMDEKAALFDGRPDPTGAGFWIRRFCADGGYAKKYVWWFFRSFHLVHFSLLDFPALGS